MIPNLDQGKEKNHTMSSATVGKSTKDKHQNKLFQSPNYKANQI